MATIKDLFKQQNTDLYGVTGKIFIESKGLINPPRGAALLLSSPNSIGDLIGNQIAGAIGGSANRPSDTIFKDDSFLAKPISLFKTPGALRDAIEKGQNYFVKTSPAPASVIGKVLHGASSPIGAIGQIGVGLIKALKNSNPTNILNLTNYS